MKKWIEMGAQAVCVAASLLGLAVAVWVVITGQPVKEGIDGMFLLVVGLMFAVFFGLIPLQAIRRGEWKVFARRGKKAEVKHDPGVSA